MMLSAVLLTTTLLAVGVRARPPTCAVLFCGDGERCDELLAERWVEAALEEQARHWKTANGAFMPPSCTGRGSPILVEPYSIDESAVLCIDAWDVPEAKCAFKQCQLTPEVHPELFESDDCLDSKRANAPTKWPRRANPWTCGLQCDGDDGANKDDRKTNKGKKCRKREPGKGWRPDKKEKDKAACRTLGSWRQIALAKLGDALDAREVANAAGATTSACAADFIYHFINQWLFNNDHPDNLPWLNERARERQRIRAFTGRLKRITSMSDGAEIEVRFLQQTASCAPLAPPTNVAVSTLNTGTEFGGIDVVTNVDDSLSDLAIIPFYTTAGAPGSLYIINVNGNDPTLRATAIRFGPPPAEEPADAPVDKPGQPPSKKKKKPEVVEPSNACTDESEQIAGLPAFVKEQKVDVLTAPRAFAVGRTEGEPVVTRSSLTTTASNAWLPLFDGSEFIDANGGQQALVTFATPANQPPIDPAAFDDLLASTIQQRTIDELTCTKNDVLVSDALTELIEDGQVGVGTADGGEVAEQEDDAVLPPGQFARPRAGVPLTLAPDVSVCVNGTRAGQTCSMPSECPAGYACRRKPFAPQNVAYCYDGSTWDQRRICAFADADEECPFGQCVGEVTGLSGGAYPFYWFYKNNDCANSANAASEVCADERVAHWQQYGNPSAFE